MSLALYLSLLSFVLAQSANENATVSEIEEPSAECAAEVPLEYNMPFHIAGVFIILAVSSIGMFGFLFLGHMKKPPTAVGPILQLAKMFGIGIIAGTAWIHLLPEAFGMFTNPCLDAGWQKYGPAWVGVFGLFAAFMVQLLEMASHSHVKKNASAGSVQNDSEAQCPSHIVVEHAHLSTGAPHLEDTIDVPHRIIAVGEHTEVSDVSMSKEGSSTPIYSDSKSKKQITLSSASTIVLEFGILFHSVIIGLTLGVADDATFNTLIVAICFHQLFEGMALGAFVSSTDLSLRSKIVLGLMYPLTTPIGIAIGIGFHQAFNGNSNTLILMQGILNSLSAGILIYSTYCVLVGGEILHNPAFYRYSKNFKVACFLMMYLGAAAMALLAVWA